MKKLKLLPKNAVFETPTFYFSHYYSEQVRSDFIKFPQTPHIFTTKKKNHYGDLIITQSGKEVSLIANEKLHI